MEYLNQYWKVLTTEFLQRNDKEFQSNAEVFKEGMIADIFGGEQPKPISGRQLQREDEFLNTCLRGIMEIVSSRENLHNAVRYMQRFPSIAGVSKSRFLAYHFEHYLNEAYILSRRLKAHVRIVKKLFRKSNQENRVGATVDSLETLIDAGFNELIGLRGHHVHKSRIKRRELDRLSAMELYLLMPEIKKIVSKIYPSEVRKIKKNLISEISKANESIDELLDNIFKVLGLLIIDKNGKVGYPSAAV